MALAGCETQHSFWVRNRTASDIRVRVEADWELEASDCVRERFATAESFDRTVVAGGDLCFSGPVVGAGDDYDVLDHVVLLRVVRNGNTCVEGDGAGTRGRFAREMYSWVLTVDDALCP